jgi:hypothetical protein
MRRIRRAVLASICLSGLALAQKVAYNYDRTANFSTFHTYKWVTIEGSSGISPITSQNIVSLVNAQLAQKGFTPVEGDRPADLYVGYQASVDKQRELNWFNSGGYWTGGVGSATVSVINLGTLVLDVYNPTQRHLVWRGSATDTVNPAGDPNKNYEKLGKAIAKLMKPFPPPPLK